VKKTAKSHVVGKHPRHAKQTSPTAAHLQGEINTLKREVAGLLKHHKPPKKHHVKHHKHHKPKKRGLAVGDMAACCAAEALAASLRLSGRPVADEDVLALYWRTAADLDAGASIGETLEAAWLYGLGGVRPVFAERPLPVLGGDRHEGDLAAPLGRGDLSGIHGLILGVDLPGPHTVLATPEGWWSWGELHDPAEWPDAVIEEAWAVTWR